MRFILDALTLGLLLLACLPAATLRAGEWVPEGTAHTVVETPEQIDAKMAWWREARFGMFVHWGLYAIPAGQWNGKPVPGIGEWILKNGQVPIADYKALAKRFDPMKFDADAWVTLAKGAGMKYIVITSKHHDGFAMFDSDADPFNIHDATPFKRDPLAELAAACKKHGVRLGFYYSQDQDWTAPGGAVIGNTWDPAQAGSFAEYLRVKSIPQFKEILKYEPEVIWFDTPTTDMTPQLAQPFVDLLKQHPHIIWNERLGGGFKGNFRTPEQRIPGNGLNEDWETCMTMNGTWGYRSDDHNWKSTSTLVRNLIDVASKGGNYLLNVGPTAEGLIPGPSVERLAQVGEWMKANGDAVYGTTASPFRRKFPWGRATHKPGKVFFHVFDWPTDGALTLPLANEVKRAYLLSAPDVALETSTGEDGVRVTLPANAPDAIASVIVAEVEGTVKEVQAQPIKPAADGTITLGAASAEIVGTDAILEASGTPNVGFWSNAKDYVEWNVAVARPGEFDVAIEYSCQADCAGGTFALGAGDQKLTGTVGSTDVWTTYTTLKPGTLKLDAGPVTITLKPTRKPGPAFMNLRRVTLTPVVP